MTKPILSPDFTVDDIHKLREYDYENIKDMSFEEIKAYYENKAESFKKILKKKPVYLHKA
jgi:hypothetical protein